MSGRKYAQRRAREEKSKATSFKAALPAAAGKVARAVPAPTKAIANSNKAKKQGKHAFEQRDARSASEIIQGGGESAAGGWGLRGRETRHFRRRRLLLDFGC